MENTGGLIEFLWYEILLLLLLAGAAILIARVVANWARREEPAEDLTLEDVRQMLSAGKIDRAEFERLKERILARQRELMGPAAPVADRTEVSSRGQKNGGENSSPDHHKPTEGG